MVPNEAPQPSGITLTLLNLVPNCFIQHIWGTVSYRDDSKPTDFDYPGLNVGENQSFSVNDAEYGPPVLGAIFYSDMLFGGVLCRAIGTTSLPKDYNPDRQFQLTYTSGLASPGWRDVTKDP